MVGPQTLTARFRANTPLFMAGAEHTPELRAPSVKGVLRFWWRALAFARCGGDRERIRREEAELFGSSATGQGRVVLALRPTGKADELGPKKVPEWASAHSASGLRYLGYGVIQPVAQKADPAKNRPERRQGELLAPCMSGDFGFDLLLRAKGLNVDQRNQLAAALAALGLLGGLGAKSRKGFGSVTLERLEGAGPWEAPTDAAALQQALTALLAPAAAWSAEPEYTAFSARTHVRLLAEGSDALQLLGHVGERLQRYRSWGRAQNGEHRLPDGRTAEQNFPQDHDLALSAARGRVGAHPQRVVFGLPHNYYFSGNTKLNVEPACARRGEEEHDDGACGLDRRASPLLLHLHRFGPQRFAAIAAILPARFLPQGAEIKVGQISRVPAAPDYGVLYGFLDGREGHRDAKSARSYFPDARILFAGAVTPGEGAS